MTSYILHCADCGYETPEDAFYIRCPQCDGLLEVMFSGGSVAFPYAAEPTPLFRSDAISEWVGAEVWCKDETVGPSGTWKDREGPLTIQRLVKHGIEHLAMFSSGNAGTAVALEAGKARGPHLHLVIPMDSGRRITTYLDAMGNDYVHITLDSGSNDEAARTARRLATVNGWAAEGGFFNYARREGLKSFAAEVNERFDWYVQAVAGGIGVYAMEKYWRDIGKPEGCPRIIGVQADICAPMYAAWKAGAAELEPVYVPKSIEPSPYVRVLRTRNPEGYRYVKGTVDRTRGAFEAVSGEEIRQNLYQIFTEPHFRAAYESSKRLVGLEAATALAGLKKAADAGTVERRARVLLNVSGAAKVGDVDVEWLRGAL